MKFFFWAQCSRNRFSREEGSRGWNGACSLQRSYTISSSFELVRSSGKEESVRSRFRPGIPQCFPFFVLLAAGCATAPPPAPPPPPPPVSTAVEAGAPPAWVEIGPEGALA